ncbi:MAG: hypothetical protein K940chlam3_00347 [Chlamydiae bacterium]|nr:hypothetical protein [Chlamydiota bacterium]
MIEPSLSHLCPDVLTYIGTFLDSGSVLNLMKTCRHCYYGIDYRIVDFIFQKEGKLCSYEEVVRLFDLKNGIKEYDRLTNYIFKKECTFDLNQKSWESTKFFRRTAKLIPKLKYISPRAYLKLNFYHACHQRDQLESCYQTGECYIMEALGPKTYCEVPNLQDLSDDDYEFKVSKSYFSFSKLLGYTSKKFPIVKGTLNGNRFVIIQFTCYNYYDRSPTTRKLATLAIKQGSSRNDWTLSNNSSAPINVFGPLCRSGNVKSIFNLVHGSMVSLPIRYYGSWNIRKYRFRIGYHLKEEET